MKTSIPHVNTIEDLHERLLVKRGAGFPVQLFVFFPIVGIMFWYLLMTRREVFDFYANFSGEDLVHPFGYVAPIAILLSLSVALKLYVTWGKQIPENFRVQRQLIALKALLAGVITATLFTTTIATAFLIVGMSSTMESTTFSFFFFFFFIFLIFSVAFFSARLKEELEVFRHYLGTYWRHVRVTATFDKAAYRLGEQIKLQVRDRLSERNETPHRVHLSFVEEKVVYTGGAKGTDSELQRHANHNVYLDVTAAELHRGITLTLPEPSPFAERVTALRGKRIRYWEVLVEEHRGRFYARFLVNAIQ